MYKMYIHILLLLLLLLLLRIIKNTDYISYQSIYSSRKLKKMLRKLWSIKRKVLLTVWETWGKKKGGKMKIKWPVLVLSQCSSLIFAVNTCNM